MPDDPRDDLDQGQHRIAEETDINNKFSFFPTVIRVAATERT